MSKKSRRAFLKSGATIGSLFGLASIAFRAHGTSENSIEALEGYEDTQEFGRTPLPAERPPSFNRGPVFLRSTFNRPRPTGKIPILQGATSQTETQFRVLVNTSDVYRYFVAEGLGGVRREVSPRSRAGVPTSLAQIDHIFVDGLIAGTAYWLEIESTGLAAIERRQFSTLSARAGLGDSLRVALISCMNDRYVNDQADMWAGVAKSAPEIMIFNGDSCYVDQRANGTTEGMWTRHVTTRRMFDVFKWDRLVPILTTWDDHDAGINDANNSNPYLNLAREYFQAMFSSDPVAGYTKSQGLGFSFNTHGMRFIFLDGRSYKHTDQIFSVGDELWMGHQIKSSPGPVWLVNGQQFFGGYLLGAESVEDTAPAQLQRIMQFGAAARVPMVLCSGDVHFSEVMEIEREQMGYRTYELTSSPVHSRTFPGHQYRSENPRRIDSTSYYNFMAIEMKAKAPDVLEFETVCMGAFESEFFRFKAEVRR